eukprot:m.134630 g.134630  ORF g.134630 m.134630 type:complete len:54 (-) comp13962_c0_seq6:65-226(-)
MRKCIQFPTPHNKPDKVLMWQLYSKAQKQDYTIKALLHLAVISTTERRWELQA